MISDTQFWTVTILLGIGTFLIRFSFLGLLGGANCPAGCCCTCDTWVSRCFPHWLRRW